MATYVMGTNSVHTSAALCDYLSKRVDTGDVVHVVNSHPGGERTDSDDARDGNDAMNVVESRLGDHVTVETHQYIRGNEAAEDIIKCAEERSADEIVIGVRKRNPTSKIVFGSTAQDVLLTSNIPMAVVPLEKIP